MIIAYLRLPQGVDRMGEFDITPKLKQPVTIDGVEYEVAEIGHRAIPQHGQRRRLAKPIRFVPVIRLIPIGTRGDR